MAPKKNSSLTHLMLLKLNFYLILATAGIGLAIISPHVFSEGMFMDGLIYATTAHNMAEGFGSFWIPFLSKTFNPEFFGHPPLAFAIQSFFYNIFGDSYLIEKLYSLCTVIICCIIIHRILKTAGAYQSWFSIFMMCTTPVIYWSATNNMLENTLSVFLLLSVLWMLLALKSQPKPMLMLFSGMAILAGFLTKGPVALFPLIFSFLYIAVYGQITLKRVLFALLPFLSLSFLFGMLLLFPAAEKSINQYFNIQVVEGIQNTSTVNNRFFILFTFLNQIIHIIIICIALLVFARVKKWRLEISPSYRNLSSIFLITALAGILPLMITMKQRPFYLVPALPFLFIAIGLYYQPVLIYLSKKLTSKPGRFNAIKITALVFLISGFTAAFVQSGTPGRDRELLHDVHQIGKIIHREEILDLQTDLISNWNLHGYFARYYKIWLNRNTPGENRYLLISAGNYNPNLYPGYSLVECGSTTFLLLEKSDLTRSAK